MKGIIMAGGNGTRLRPYTYFFNKHTILVYDKPLIHFPIVSMVAAGIEEIIIATNSPDQINAVLSGHSYRANIEIYDEEGSRGHAYALHNLANRIGDDGVLVMLGDAYLTFQINKPKKTQNSVIYVTTNFDRKRISEYGVVEVDAKGTVLSLEEKPKAPKGDKINIGVTFFPVDVVDILRDMVKEEGHHLVDLANRFQTMGRLNAMIYDGIHFNVGTPEDLFLATQYRRSMIQKD